MTAALVVAVAALAAALWPDRPDLSRRRALVGPSSRWSPAEVARPGVANRPQVARRATPHDVADALALLALALRSGMGQAEALERVAQVSEGPVAGHLRAVMAALRWGRPSGEAWAYAPAAWGPAAMAWQVAERAGAGPAALIEDASWRIREREDRRLEAAGARAGVRLVLPLGLAFLPAFACTAVIPVVLALGQSVLGP